MRSTMQDMPLSISRLLRHGTGVHGASTVETWTGEGAVAWWHARLREAGIVAAEPTARDGRLTLEDFEGCPRYVGKRS